MAAQLRTSMRELVREQVMGMLRAATAARQSVLVFDEFALSVLDAVLTQTEVLSLGYRVLVKLESQDMVKAGRRRHKYFPLPVVYFMRASEDNAGWILQDYGTGVEAHEPDLLERMCPCAFAGIEAQFAGESDLRPWYKDAGLLLIPGPPGGLKSSAVTSFQRTLQNAVLTDSSKYGPLKTHVEAAAAAPQLCVPEITALEDGLFTTNQPDFIRVFCSSARREAMETVLADADLGAALGSGSGVSGLTRSEMDAFLLTELDATAWRLVTLLITLREVPSIRFFNSPAASMRGSARGKAWSAILAERVVAHLQAWWSDNSWWTPVGRGSSGTVEGDAAVAVGPEPGGVLGRALHGDATSSAASLQPAEPPEAATLLIMERLDDLGAVLVHDSTYQCAVQDLLRLDPSATFHTERSTSAVAHRLDEEDFVWQRLRHKPLLVANELIAAGARARKLKGEQQALAAEGKHVKRLAKMALEQQYKRGSRWDKEYSVHEILMSAVFDQICSPGKSPARASNLSARSGTVGGPALLEMAELEMAMLCSGISTAEGATRSGLSDKRITDAVLAFLEGTVCGAEEKARLYLLWLLTQKRLPRGEWVRLDRCIERVEGSSSPLVQSLSNAQNLFLPLEREDEDVTAGMVHRISAAAAKKRLHMALDEESKYMIGFPIYMGRLEAAAAAWHAASRGKAPPPGALPDKHGTLVDGLPADEWNAPKDRVTPPEDFPGRAGTVHGRGARGATAAAARAGGASRRGSGEDGAGVETFGITARMGEGLGEGWGEGDGEDGDAEDDDDAAAAMGIGGGRRRRRHRTGGSSSAAAAASSSGGSSSAVAPGGAGAAATESVYEEPKQRRYRGARLIVFVLGGVSPQEQSALQRLSEQTGREIIVGGTSHMRPVQLLQQVRASSSPAIAATVREWAAARRARQTHPVLPGSTGNGVGGIPVRRI